MVGWFWKAPRLEKLLERRKTSVERREGEGNELYSWEERGVERELR